MSLTAKCVMREIGGVAVSSATPGIDIVKGQKYLLTCWVQDEFGMTVTLQNRSARLRLPSPSGHVDFPGTFVQSRSIDFIVGPLECDTLKVGKKMNCTLFIEGTLDASLKMAFILPEILTVRDPSV
jgi:hypothetical protein